MSLPEKLERTLADLPNKPGVYLFRDLRKRLLYVGKARNLRNRVRSYFNQSGKGPRITRMVSKINDLDIIVTATESEALILENSLIKNNKPQFNVMLRDDKTYPYIRVTEETYPRVLFTRRKDSKNGQTFGPFPSARTARQAIRVLHHHFKIRNCDLDLGTREYRPCLQFHIKRCDAPCDFSVSPETYRLGVDRAILFLQGKTDDLLAELRAEMDTASKATAFEKAAYLRDLMGTVSAIQRTQVVANLRYDKLDAVGVLVNQWQGCIVILSIRNGAIVRSSHHLVEWDEDPADDFAHWITHYYLNHPDPPKELLVREPDRFHLLLDALNKQGRFSVVQPHRGARRRILEMAEENAQTAFDLRGNNQADRSLEQLADLLDLNELPHQMECFDISHIQGTHTVASMVHFKGGKPDKSKYRKFNIKTVAGIDDFASIYEVVSRRYRRLLQEGENLPELIVIDGGLGQLHAAHRALEEIGLGAHPLISLAKREEIVYKMGHDQPIVIPHHEPALRLLQHLRDEAHRFGVTFHRKKRSKAMTHSELLDVPGVGPMRMQKLMRHFGSIDQIRSASLDQLQRVIGSKIARVVFDYFRNV